MGDPIADFDGDGTLDLLSGYPSQSLTATSGATTANDANVNRRYTTTFQRAWSGSITLPNVYFMKLVEYTAHSLRAHGFKELVAAER